MWCATCQADVAADVSPENQRAQCTTCGSDLVIREQQTRLETVPLTSKPTVPEKKTKDARELLERWSKRDMLDPYGPVISTADPIEQSLSDPIIPKSRTNELPRSVMKAMRIDGPHPISKADHDAQDQQFAAAQENQPEKQSLESNSSRLDAVHKESVPKPHFDIQSEVQKNKVRKTNWQSLIGQLLAYAGVLILTGGGSLVVLGYFGVNPEHAPTGWLIATAGQMLLFLGVVTLVSGGMEQTTEDVAEKIDSLSERLIRIEQMTREQGRRPSNLPTKIFPEDADKTDQRQGSRREQSNQFV